MPLEAPARIVSELTGRGYNAEREAVTLLANADDPRRAVERTVESVPEDTLVITADQVRTVLGTAGGTAPATGSGDPPVSTGVGDGDSGDGPGPTARETEGGGGSRSGGSSGSETATAVAPEETAADAPATSTERPGSGDGTTGVGDARSRDAARGERPPDPIDVVGDVTGASTGTGEYGDFVSVFRDRYDRLSRLLRSRVNPRPAEAVEAMPGGGDAAMVGLVNDVRSTASGHRLVELEDTTGTFPTLVMKDREFASEVETILEDEVIAVEGTLADDGGILFVDDMHFPDVPRNHSPSTADRHVQAALVSDVHVGSHEFMADAWSRFADWLHTPEADPVEYLLIAGDMVEGVGVYPDQDEELSIVDVYDQYERFSEYLKEVPGDMEVVMIPGNHDAVRLAEPQPGFTDELRDIMSAHDARIYSNPSTVTVEGVSFLMYHGVSLDEVIAEFPEDEASYDDPQKAMKHLLKKRHLAPKFGGHMRLAPEERDYLVIDEVPDVFHTGHVHKLGYGTYRNVLTINSGCWQSQTAFQESVNIDPDAGYAPIVDLDTLDLTIREFV